MIDVAVFPVPGCVAFPGMKMPLHVFEPRYLNMVDDALKAERLIGMVQDLGDGELTKVGGLGRIIQFAEMDDGRYMMVLRGLKRFQTTQILDVTTPYQQAEISFDDFARDIDIHEDQQTPEALRIDKSERGVLTMAMKSYAKTLGVKLDWESLKEIPIDRLVDQAAMISPFDPADKQSLLEAKTHEERRRLLIGLMHLYARPHDGDSGTLQ